MLSYQHEYHAGNGADVLKHICLVQILKSLTKKEKPFTIIDSHSGSGVFDLNDSMAKKTLESESGVLRLRDFCKKNGDSIPECVLDYLKVQNPYLDKNRYAGSPEIAYNFSKKGDRLDFIELHPFSYAKLQTRFEKQKENAPRVFLHNTDTYKSINALIPPKIKRGLVLCDPSYEEASDWQNAESLVKTVHKKWNTAIIALWYPLLAKEKNASAKLISALENQVKIGLHPAECFSVELVLKDIKEFSKESKANLYGSGMFVINPPWHLKENLELAIPFLRSALGTF